MKKITLLFFLFALASVGCAAYFDSDVTTDTGRVEALALNSWNGFLSSSVANDIDPAIYRFNGNAYLIFSSDRNGSYDLFVAKMGSDGRFQAPVMLGESVNTGLDETSPTIVAEPTGYYDQMFNFIVTNTNLRLSFIRTSDTHTQIIVGLLTATNLELEAGSSNGYVAPFIFAHLTGYNLDYTLKVILAGGNIADLMIGGNSFLTPMTNIPGIQSLRSAIQGFIPQSSSLHLYSASFLSGGYCQLGACADQVDPAYFTHYNIGEYSVSADETAPFVEALDGYRVYFASKRSGSGNYDLYRYNIKNFYNTVMSRYSTFSWGEQPN